MMTFEKDDILKRKKYSEFLTEIVINCDKYKRSSDSDSFTLALDSSWGTGKTTFINKWIKELEKIRDEEGNNKFHIINYSAWENDFFDDCFQSLLYKILIDDSLNNENDNKTINNIISDGVESLKEIGKITLNSYFKKIFGDDSDKVIDLTSNLLKTFKGIKRDVFNDTSFGDTFDGYKKYANTLNEFKIFLGKASENKKIIIVIDELDRCKPTFSVQLLEIVKHILDVPNVVFVFSLDMLQLSYSIETIYGLKIDGNGYLTRFFDYVSKIPPINIESYIDYLLEDKPLLNIELSEKININEIYINIDFKHIFKKLAEIYNLSLRDINTIYSNFKLFESIELKNNKNIRAYELYLFLLIMKYKDNECFNDIFRKNISNKNIFDHTFVSKVNNLDVKEFKIRGSINHVSNKILKEEKFNILGQNINVGCIIKVDTVEKHIYYKEQYHSVYIKYDANINISNILFLNDIENWENIKEMSIKEFLHKKLEFFDFSNKIEE